MVLVQTMPISITHVTSAMQQQFQINTLENPGVPEWSIALHRVIPSPDSHRLPPAEYLTAGDDGISYYHLKKMPSTHRFLATLVLLS